jgi:hypothetical protein
MLSVDMLNVIMLSVVVPFLFSQIPPVQKNWAVIRAAKTRSLKTLWRVLAPKFKLKKTRIFEEKKLPLLPIHRSTLKIEIWRILKNSSDSNSAKNLVSFFLFGQPSFLGMVWLIEYGLSV